MRKGYLLVFSVLVLSFLFSACGKNPSAPVMPKAKPKTAAVAAADSNSGTVTVTPTNTRTHTPTPRSTSIGTVTLTPTSSPTRTPTSTQTMSPTVTATNTRTAYTSTPTATRTRTPMPTSTPTIYVSKTTLSYYFVGPLGTTGVARALEANGSITRGTITFSKTDPRLPPSQGYYLYNVTYSLPSQAGADLTVSPQTPVTIYVYRDYVYYKQTSGVGYTAFYEMVR